MRISIILLILLFIITGCGQAIQQTTDKVTGIQAVEQKIQADQDLALIQARTLLRQAQMDGQDLSNGPCLSDNLIPDWVLDIAHNPRQPVDNLPANQCPSFRSGQAHHFIEMDQNGEVINIQ